MSKNIFSEDLCGIISSSEENSSDNTVNINNPYSFQSFLDVKCDKGVSFDNIDRFPVSSDYDGASSKLPYIEILSMPLKIDSPIQSLPTEPKISNEIQDNPFSFKHFLRTEYPQSNIDLLIENSSSELNISLPEHSKLRNENSELKNENLSLLMKLQNLREENSSLILKLEKLQKKDSEEAKALNTVIYNVEENLCRANKRALIAEKRFENLNSVYLKLKKGTDSNIRDFYCEHTQSIGSKIRTASTEAEYMLNQMLTGVGNLRQISDLLESLPKLYEPIDSKNIV